ncbi:MAG: RIP metalloprotease RseP [candidate division WOR-3 bacterium]|nr:RIP metalloprotease RseP [candidate division WOR-3 bacterium]MCX7836565.1 RIP metalloprotease RseP [candidate division WOR-3 bacterium]MDW8113910.1 RIP metalloprotease RseP [candidate division WOR-3 bacterium]
MNLLIVAIVIGVLITIHEIGHLITAKIYKIPVEKFSIGFGPTLIKKQIKETTYSLSLIPLGGYIKLKGEEEEEENGFLLQPTGKKLMVVFMGPLANLILGVFLIFLLYFLFGIKYSPPIINFERKVSYFEKGDILIAINNDTIKSFEEAYEFFEKNLNKKASFSVLRKGKIINFNWIINDSFRNLSPLILPVLEKVKKGSPADKAGLKPKDTIIAINDTFIYSWENLIKKIRSSGGKEIKITYRRGRVFSTYLTPQLVAPDTASQKVGQIGVWVYLPKKKIDFFSAFYQAIIRSGYVIFQTFVILYKLIIGEISRKALGGPIMVAQLTYESLHWGWEYFLALFGLLAINLFVVNMLPIPVLDGGRGVIFIIEHIIKRRLTKKELNTAITIGWIIIMLLILFTFYNDLSRIFKTK